MQRTDTNPNDFLASLADNRRADLIAIDRIVSRELPGRERVLWKGVFWGGTDQTIIGYGDLVQVRPRSDDVEWFVIGLALQKKHISLYVNAVEEGGYLGSLYGDRLGKVKIGSASIGFTSADQLDLDVVAELASHAHRISPPDRPFRPT